MHMAYLPSGLLAVLALFALPGHAATPPADASFDGHSPNKTLAPKVVVNSGRLDWAPYQRDLTPWVTLSHQDKRPGSRAKKVSLTTPLNGDPTNGKHLAMEWCAVCHQLPGDEWPGTLGNTLSHYGQYQYEDGKVFQQIFDARVFNPNTVMPPYGTHGLLTQQDIRDLVAYLQSRR